MRPDPGRHARVEAASQALSAGSRFLEHSLPRGCDHVIGNGLRELDRFLNELLDAAASAVAPAGFDQRSFARRSGVPGKLGIVSTLLAAPSPHMPRLRAIGRMRAALPHAGGSIGRRDVAARSGSRALARADLPAICAFYQMLAGELLLGVASHRPLH